MAIACDQTRVFNAEVGSQALRHAGSTFTWHTATHEEATDEKLGYQKEVYAFVTGANKVTPRKPPELGEHNEQILLEAGYDAAAIAHLRENITGASLSLTEQDLAELDNINS